jgi:hypothetical protein
MFSTRESVSGLFKRLGDVGGEAVCQVGAYSVLSPWIGKGTVADGSGRRDAHSPGPSRPGMSQARSAALQAGALSVSGNPSTVVGRCLASTILIKHPFSSKHQLVKGELCDDEAC